MINGLVEECVNGGIRGTLLFLMKTRTVVLGGATNYDRSTRSSSVETIFTEDPKGPTTWEGNMLVPLF